MTLVILTVRLITHKTGSFGSQNSSWLLLSRQNHNNVVLLLLMNSTKAIIGSKLSQVFKQLEWLISTLPKKAFERQIEWGRLHELHIMSSTYDSSVLKTLKKFRAIVPAYYSRLCQLTTLDVLSEKKCSFCKCLYHHKKSAKGGSGWERSKNQYWMCVTVEWTWKT